MSANKMFVRLPNGLEAHNKASEWCLRNSDAARTVLSAPNKAENGIMWDRTSALQQEDALAGPLKRSQSVEVYLPHLMRSSPERHETPAYFNGLIPNPELSFNITSNIKSISQQQQHNHRHQRSQTMFETSPHDSLDLDISLIDHVHSDEWANFVDPTLGQLEHDITMLDPMGQELRILDMCNTVDFEDFIQ